MEAEPPAPWCFTVQCEIAGKTAVTLPLVPPECVTDDRTQNALHELPPNPMRRTGFQRLLGSAVFSSRSSGVNHGSKHENLPARASPGTHCRKSNQLLPTSRTRLRTCPESSFFGASDRNIRYRKMNRTPTSFFVPASSCPLFSCRTCPNFLNPPPENLSGTTRNQLSSTMCSSGADHCSGNPQRWE